MKSSRHLALYQPADHARSQGVLLLNLPAERRSGCEGCHTGGDAPQRHVCCYQLPCTKHLKPRPGRRASIVLSCHSAAAGGRVDGQHWAAIGMWS